LTMTIVQSKLKTETAIAAGTVTIISAPVQVVIASGYINNASGISSGMLSRALTNLYPITLDRAGIVRGMGTLTLLVTGIGGASTGVRGAMNWKEVR